MPTWLKRTTIILVSLVIILGVIFVAADFGVKQLAQQTVSNEIPRQFPEGVTGDVATEIRGFPVIPQLVGKDIDEMKLSSKNFTAEGQKVPWTVTLQNVDPDRKKPVSHLAGTLEASSAAVSHFVKLDTLPGTVSLEGSDLIYHGETKVGGMTIKARITLAVTAQGDRILLQPTNLQVDGAPAGINGSALFGDLGKVAIPVCTAQMLPKGIQVDKVTIKNGTAHIDVHADNFALTSDSLRSKGSCA